MINPSIPRLARPELSEDTAKTSNPSTKKSTTDFFYPSLTPPAAGSSSNQTMVVVPPMPSKTPPPPPHPYQVAAYYDLPPLTPNSRTHFRPVTGRYINGTVSSSPDVVDGEKLHQIRPTYVIQHQHHHHHHHHPPPPPPPSSSALPSSNVPNPQDPVRSSCKLRLLIFLLVFLPIPPLLSLLYLVIGHPIIRRASSPSSLIDWSPSLLSSVNAGATGGVILSLPLFLLLFLLLAPAPSSSPTRAAHEDFFDDDDESRADRAGHARQYAKYATCISLLLCIGGAAGALGVTCLGSGEHAYPGEVPLMLTPGRAAVAGLVGGVVLWASLAVATALAFGGWYLWDSWVGKEEK